MAGLNSQEVTQLDGEVALADPALRREERRGGGLGLLDAQGFVKAAAATAAKSAVATAPVPKSVSECDNAVSGAGPASE